MTPSPDKLEIPEAAVEAAARAMAKVIGDRNGALLINWLSEARYEEARAALAAALPHMPDRGYAKVKSLEWNEDTSPREDGPSETTGDWTAWSPFGEFTVNLDTDEEMAANPWCAWTPDGSLGHFPELDGAKSAAQADYATRIRSALITPPAPADNDVPVHILFDGEYDPTGPEAGAGFRDALPTPSPIEDVAGPSEAEIEAAAKIIDSNAFEGELQSSYWHSRRDNARDRARRVLAARRVRPSPVDEDARDGVLEALKIFADQADSLDDEITDLKTTHGWSFQVRDFRRARDAYRLLQSQQKG